MYFWLNYSDKNNNLEIILEIIFVAVTNMENLFKTSELVESDKLYMC